MESVGKLQRKVGTGWFLEQTDFYPPKKRAFKAIVS